MSGKFMKVRRVVIPTLTLIIMASQLMGCAATSQDETLGMLNNATEIEVEVAELDTDKQGKGGEQAKSETELEWIELASLTTIPEIRENWNETSLGIVVKEDGTEIREVFIDENGNYNGNNTLRMAMITGWSLKESVALGDVESAFYKKAELAVPVSEYYSDIDNLEVTDILEEIAGKESAYNTAYLAGINAYFNLLPDYEPAYANMGSSLTRKEFMAMVFRADTPVQEIEADKSFTEAVGETEYNLYAQNLQNNSYLDIESQSLNEQTYNGTMTRAEAIYMLVSRYYAEELSNIDTDAFTIRQSGIIDPVELNTEFTDAKDGGASSFEKGTEYWKADTLNNAIQNPDSGLPTELFAALAIASHYGIIDPSEDTRWDEALTKEDALQLLVNTYANENQSAISEASTEGVDFKTNEEKEADAAAAEEAQLQANIEEYKKLSAEEGNENRKTESPSHQLQAKILNNRSQAEKEVDAADGYVGYDLKLGEDGLHYLVDILSGEKITIGMKYGIGMIYTGEYDCREDMLYWYKLNHPDTTMTDDEIAALYNIY